jgi:hypothetical protein
MESRQSSSIYLLKHLLMLSFPKLLVLLMNIDQDTILTWFGIESQTNSSIDTNSTSAISGETFQLIINNLWQRVQDGLTLTDIDFTPYFFVHNC